MEDESFLYDLIEPKLQDYRHKIDAERKDDNFKKWVAESRAELEKVLNAEQLKLLNNYVHVFNLELEYVEMLTGIQILNYGIKIGMQLQNALDQLAE